MDDPDSRFDLDSAGNSAVQVIEPAANVSSRRERKHHVANEPRTLRPPLGIVAASICGGLAAIFYTLANIALRQCVGVDPFLVSAVKAAPTVLLLGPFLAWLLFRGETIATSARVVPRFIVISFVAHLLGNAGFQIALGVIGLAASVPITLGVLIIGGAILGRVMLHEPVRRRVIVAIITLIAAVVVLSLPGASVAAESATIPVWAGALCAAASGAAYALFGVVMRQALTGGLSTSATMFISGMVGSITLWSVTLMRLGIEPIESIAASEWGVMAAAGIFNFTAFTALSVALKSLPVVAVNLINASQVAMAAAAGVILFSEPLTASLIIGIALTIVGLMILANWRGIRIRRL
jgi:DME family drug/metabolite transporter